MVNFYVSFSSFKEYVFILLPLAAVQIAVAISPVAAMSMIARVGGPTSIAIIGLANFVIFIIFVPATQTIIDVGGLYFAIYFGAHQYNFMVSYFYKTLFTLLFFYIISGVIFYFSGKLLILMRVDSVIAIPAGELIWASMLYLPLLNFNSFIQTFLSSQNVHKHFNLISIFSSFLVFGLCYYFIVYRKMKEWGFIPAKSIQEGFTFCLYLVLLFFESKKDCLRKPKLKYLFKDYPQFLRRLISSLISVFGEFFSFEINTYLAALLHNVNELALWEGWANTIFIPFFISLAIANTFRTKIGQLIGAGKIKTAREQSIAYIFYSFWFAFIIGIIFWTFASDIAFLFIFQPDLQPRLIICIRIYALVIFFSLIFYTEFTIFRLLKLDHYFLIMIAFIFPPFVVIFNVIIVFFLQLSVEGLVFGHCFCTGVMACICLYKIFILHDWSSNLNKESDYHDSENFPIL